MDTANLTMIANAAARFVHNGMTYKWPNAKLLGTPLAFTGWLFIDTYTRLIV